jgi:amidophosphoribosyltransferase
MSDALQHECGIALVRLLKPLEFYKEKYGTAFYGIQKMYLLMENNTIEDKMVLVLQVCLIWNQVKIY